MYWIVKALSVVLLPPGLIVLAIVLALVLLATGRRRSALVLLAGSAGLLYALSISPVTDALIGPLENRYADPGARTLECDALAVLGGGLIQRASPEGALAVLSHTSAERVNTAFRLWREAHRPILLSGGNTWDFDTPEAIIMAGTLEGLGVPASDLSVEWWSRNTFENARFGKASADAFGWKKLCVITSAYHLTRTVRAFRAAGMEVVAVPADVWASAAAYSWRSLIPAAGHLHGSTLALREYLSLAWYRLHYGI
jgi:uncharacterized SAM-binding protein YcdF (DUF218 family)